MRVFFMRHLQGESRTQSTLFPESLDEYVSAENPVRVIDAFIDTLNMQQLGFTLATTQDTGRKPYHPADLLKLYIYGYLNQLRSTRRLEKECHRNIEVLWLMKRLAPDFKTIANFRQHNSAAIRHACSAFIQFCRAAHLLDNRLIAIDGSKFKAAASPDKVCNPAQIARQQKHLEQDIADYLHALSDSEQRDVHTAGDVQTALHTLRARQQHLSELAQRMHNRATSHICTTEPEAKRMRSGREGIILGYNVQTAVEASSGLIIHHDVTDESTDNRSLLPVALAAQKTLRAEKLNVLADSGYSNGEQIAACEIQGITPTLPVNRAKNNQGDFYQKDVFRYVAEKNIYLCPAHATLHYQTYSQQKKIHLYAKSGCTGCALQPNCTRTDKRWISRHFHEDALNRCQARAEKNPELMKQRSAIVERPFAHLKQIQGLRRFICWGLLGAQAEMGLAVMAYNLNRMMKAHGVERMLALLA